MPLNFPDKEKFFRKSFENNEDFFASKWGQQIILLLAPFVLPPQEKDKDSLFEKVFSFLRLRFLAPFIGAGFVISALGFCMRVLKSHGLNFNIFINFDSIAVLSHLTALLGLITYCAALSRFLAPWILKAMYRKQTLVHFPLSFWTARYGGLLIFSGIIFWLLTLSLWLSAHYWLLILFVIGIGMLVFFARLELKRQEQKLTDYYPAFLQEMLHTVEFFTFLTTSLFMAFGYLKLASMLS